VDNSQPKRRFPLGRVARLTFRALAVTTLVALVVGWIVSYRITFSVTGYLQSNYACGINFYLGELQTGWMQLDVNPLWPSQSTWRFDSGRPDVDGWNRLKGIKPFVLTLGDSNHSTFILTVPFWFLTTLAARGAAHSFKRTWRFTTRELLIATTAVAAVLAAAVWSMRG
jgi:hypothetical protein